MGRFRTHSERTTVPGHHLEPGLLRCTTTIGFSDSDELTVSLDGANVIGLRHIMNTRTPEMATFPGLRCPTQRNKFSFG